MITDISRRYQKDLSSIILHLSFTIVPLICAAMLSSCHTVKNVVSSAYDEHPENKQPVLERPAWPNYDLHDDRSFAAFSHVQTAPRGEGTYLKQEDGSWTGGRTTIYRCKDATYVCFDWDVPAEQDWWFFRENSGAAIVDADTGDRYVVQSHEHFPLDQCFWIYGHKNETVRLITRYPPLPLSVKRIRLYSPTSESRRWMSGEGYLTKAYNLDDLRPNAKSQETKEPKKQGRIIR